MGAGSKVAHRNSKFIDKGKSYRISSPNHDRNKFTWTHPRENCGPLWKLFFLWKRWGCYSFTAKAFLIAKEEPPLLWPQLFRRRYLPQRACNGKGRVWAALDYLETSVYKPGNKLNYVSSGLPRVSCLLIFLIRWLLRFQRGFQATVSLEGEKGRDDTEANCSDPRLLPETHIWRILFSVSAEIKMLHRGELG